MGRIGLGSVFGNKYFFILVIGGKKLHYMCVNKVLIPQIQMGINPVLCVYQPFK